MSGEAAALAPLAERSAELDTLAEDEAQLGLFSEPLTERGRERMALVRRGPGRPPGARNKRTEATVAALLARYRDPRAVALERIQMHPADLAVALGCSIYEAAVEQRLYIQAVAPFLHARITPEVIDNRQVIHLHLGSFGDAAASPETMVRVIEPAEIEPAADQSSAETDDATTG